LEGSRMGDMGGGAPVDPALLGWKFFSAITAVTCLSSRYNEASFTCAASPALALVFGWREMGSEYGHMLLFTKTLLVGQPLGLAAGCPNCPRAKGEEEREVCHWCWKEQWRRGWWDRLECLLHSDKSWSSMEHHGSKR
jgi:hypothetical protein